MPVADTTHAQLRAERRRLTLAALGRVLAELGADVLARFSAGESVLLRPDEWNTRLRDAIYAANRTTAAAIAARVAADLGADFDPSVMDAWLLANATATAEEFNNATAADLEAATAEPEPDDGSEGGPAVAVALAVEAARGYRLTKFSNSLVSVSSAFGASEAAEATGSTGEMMKEWKVNSSNPRASHRRLNGVRVPFSERFPNRLRWPGDAKSGDADELANCKCSVVFVIP